MSKKVSEEEWLKRIKLFLETENTIPLPLKFESSQRVHDDHDGTGLGRITIAIGENGSRFLDMFVAIGGNHLCFRNPVIGGGSSPRVYQALRILKLAIDLDNADPRLPKNPTRNIME